MTGQDTTIPNSTQVELSRDRARIDALIERILDLAAEQGFDKGSVFAIRLALEEAITNAFEHGHSNLRDEQVRVEYSVNSHLPGPRRHDAVRPARGRGDAAVLHRDLRQPRLAQPPFGWEAEDGVDMRAQQVAALIGADEKEIIFTSGSTESNNLAIKGAATMYEKAPAGQTKPRPHHHGLIEHKAVLDPCKRLQKEGFDVTFLEPARDGVSPEMVKRRDARRHHPREHHVGEQRDRHGQRDPEIGALCHERGVIFHTDATQWVGKMPTDVEKDNVDLLSMSGTRSTGPRAWARCTSAAASPACRLPLSKAAGRSAASAPAR
jgi:hypothetical protein